MTQLKELLDQRKMLDEKIKELKAGNETIRAGNCTLRFYNKNYPQMNEQINLSVQKYNAFGDKTVNVTLFFAQTKDEASARIKELISDLQNILGKIEQYG